VTFAATIRGRPLAALRRVQVVDRLNAAEAAEAALKDDRAPTALWIRDLAASFDERVASIRDARRRAPPSAPVFAARDPMAALAAGADGVVLAADGPKVALAREILGEAAWIGRSTHAPEEAAAAARQGADFVVFGPIRETPSKKGILEPRGFLALAEAARRSTAPVVAIGGLGVGDEEAVARAGAVGFAAIRAFLRTNGA
jgi:thiamine-phosphate diphosphorylase